MDLATRTVMRVRVPWPEGHEPDISTFDVVEVTLADDPERDDLAQPEATTVADLPRHVGTLRGRHLRKLLRRLVASPDGPLLGFPGPSAPYWEFRGFRPSVALIEPTRRPQLIRRQADGTTWVRFGWDRDDVWLPVEDRNAARALDAARRERLSGKSLSDRARIRAAVPPGDGQPTPGRPLLQGLRRGLAPGLMLGRPPGAGEPGSAAELAPGQVLGHGPPEGHQAVPPVGLEAVEVRLDTLRGS